MQKAKRLACVTRQRAPVGASGFQQCERTLDVGTDEFARPLNRTIHMRLGGKMHHRPRAMLGQQGVHPRPVADVAAHEDMARIALKRGKIIQVAGIGQIVQIDHRLASFPQPVKNKVGADKTGTASDEDHDLSFLIK